MNQELMLSTAIEDADFPTTVKMNVQSALTGIVDDAYWMADDICVEGIQKLQSISNKFRSWFNMKHTENKKEIEKILIR